MCNGKRRTLLTCGCVSRTSSLLKLSGSIDGDDEKKGEASSANAKNASSTRFERVIFHVDMDSFYASCELSLRPELKDTPFIVGADPKDGKGRGVVIACNYPARKLGVRSALPISKAWELCPQAVYVRPNFDFYGRVSEAVFEIIRQFADRVEQVSIDEAYLDVTGRVASMMMMMMMLSQDHKANDDQQEYSIRSLASSIKESIREKQGITCSIGVAESKIVAKIATDMNKPDGLTIVKPGKVMDFLAPLPVGRIPGVGKVTEGILNSRFGIRTIADLRGTPIEDLESAFGRNSAWLHNVANGIDRSEVVERWEHVSLSGETTFEQDESDFSKVAKAMYDVAQDVHRRAVSENYTFRNVGIKVRFSGFETHTRSRSLKVPTTSLEILNAECEKLLSEFARSGKKVRLIGVRVSSLERSAEGQSSLLDWQK